LSKANLLFKVFKQCNPFHRSSFSLIRLSSTTTFTRSNNFPSSLRKGKKKKPFDTKKKSANQIAAVTKKNAFRVSIKNGGNVSKIDLRDFELLLFVFFSALIFFIF
jgi:hypothetical protein